MSDEGIEYTTAHIDRWLAKHPQKFKPARKAAHKEPQEAWNPNKRNEDLAKKQKDDSRLLRDAKERRQRLISTQIIEHPSLGKWIAWTLRERKTASMIELGILDVDGVEAARMIQLHKAPEAIRRTAFQEYCTLVDKVCTKACGMWMGDPLPVEMGGYEGDILLLQRFLRLH